MIIVALLIVTVLISFAMAESVSEGAPVRLSALEWDDPQFLETLVFYGGVTLCFIVVLATVLVIHVKPIVIGAAVFAGLSLLLRSRMRHPVTKTMLLLITFAATAFVLISSLRG